MFINVNLTSHISGSPRIVQVAHEPSITINGGYVIPTPSEDQIPVSSSSYVLPVDGGDILSQSFANLLARYPQYNHVYFNPLLTDADLDELDLSGTFTDSSVVPPVIYSSRFQTGRAASVGSQTGQMPTSTAILPANTAVSPSRPGLLVTQEIDLSAYALDCHGNPTGVTEFMPYWCLLGFGVSDDIFAEDGAFAGANQSVKRTVFTTPQEPAGLTVYLSGNDGASWCPVGAMEPVIFPNPVQKVRMAFVNASSSKLYLAHIALMF